MMVYHASGSSSREKACSCNAIAFGRSPNEVLSWGRGTWAADDAPALLVKNIASELAREQMLERSIVALAVELAANREQHQA